MYLEKLKKSKDKKDKIKDKSNYRANRDKPKERQITKNARNTDIKDLKINTKEI